MWFLFALVSLLCYALSDLLGKKHSGSENTLAVPELLATANILAGIAGLVIYAAGLGESGLAPWQILYRQPMILVSVLCFILHWLFFLFSLRYIGLSVDEAVQSSFGVFYCVGLVVVNLCTGKLSVLREMLHPLRLVPILLVLICTVLLPNVEVLAAKKQTVALAKADRRNQLTGIALLLAATVFDSLDSLTATCLLADVNIGAVDFMQASYFSQLLPAVLFSVFISVKRKKPFIPFARSGKQTAVYALTALLSSVFYLLASSFDAVRTGILFIAFPIVPILGAKLFLKEKYTLRQNICIWTITVSAMLFCLSDAIL